MNALRSLVIMLFGIALGILTSVGVMIYGWGLEAKNWFWIIGIYTIGHIIAQLIVALGKADDQTKEKQKETN